MIAVNWWEGTLDATINSMRFSKRTLGTADTRVHKRVDGND
jgi:hypothetical protein